MSPTFRDEVMSRCRKLTLREMGAVLGVSVVYAKFLRAGRRGMPHLSRPVTVRALRKWPELWDVYRLEIDGEGLMGEEGGS